MQLKGLVLREVRKVKREKEKVNLRKPSNTKKNFNTRLMVSEQNMQQNPGNSLRKIEEYKYAYLEAMDIIVNFFCKIACANIHIHK